MRRTILGLTIAVLALPALAAPLKVSANRREIAFDETLIIKVEAQGTDFSDPVFDETADWRISPTPVAQNKTYSVQIVNGSINRLYTSTLHYRASPLREGNLTVPAVQVEVDGTVQKSAPIPVRVVGARQPNPQIGSSGPAPAKEARDSIGFDDTVILETTLDKRSVYAGEAVTMTVALYELMHSGVRVRANRPLTWPEAEGFYKSEVDTLPEARDTRDGREYLVREFRQILYPTRPGELTIGLAEWEGDVYAYTDRGRRRQTVIKTTDPIQLEVKPLPAAPAEFSGAVGRYQISAAVSRGAITQGIPFDLVVTVRGQGNTEAITPPDLPELSWAHVSSPSIDVSAVNGTNDLAKVFTFSIVPTETGAHEIPPLRFTFFAPEISEYATRQTGALKVVVLESEEGGDMIVAGGSTREREGVTMLTDDIRPIRTAVAQLRPRKSSLAVDLSVMTAPPVFFLVFFGLVRRRKRFQEDSSYARAYFARSKSQKRLQAVRASKTPVEELFKALAGYLADKLNATEAGLTSHDIDALLRASGVPEETRAAYVKVLRTCEREQYAAIKLRPDEQSALIDAGEHALEAMMDVLEQKGRKRA